MTLPKIQSPIFTVELPSSGEPVKYRPFTVREEKILLMARESGDIEQIILGVKQILNNCVIGIDVDTLPVFDVEWLLIHIRASSVDSELKFTIKDPDTKEDVDLQFSIGDIGVKRDPDHSDTIRINDEYTVVMRYPTIAETFGVFRDMAKIEKLRKIVLDSKDPEEVNRAKEELKKSSSHRREFEVMIRCLKILIGDDGSVYNFDDSTEKEIEEFVDSLEPKAISKIQKFFETVPVLRHEVKYINSKGDEKTFVMQGFETFFT